MILATTGPVWSLSLTDSATYPVARSRRAASIARVLGGSLLAIYFLPTAAYAISSQGTIAIAKWKAMDKCAIQAQQAFPDFSAESNAKRDAKLQECLASQNLPPRVPETPAR